MDTKPPRIAIDARFWRKDTAGIGRYTRELVHNLAKLDHVNQYTVILTEKDATEWDIDQPNFHTAVLPYEHYTLSEQTGFLKWLNKQNFDLVHFLNFNHPILYRKNFVVTIHDLTLFKYPADNKKRSVLRKYAFYRVFKHAVRGASKVIAISQNTLNDTTTFFGVSKNNITLIYEGGPDVDKSKYNHHAVINYLKTDSPYFLFVSQWRPHKGIVTLVSAFNQFKNRYKTDQKLVLLGSQKVATEEIIRKIKTSPYSKDIIIPGFAPEDLLPSLYHFSSAFIVPSEYEGFGLPVLEGYSYQTPTIVAHNSSLTEVAGEGALFFPTSDVVNLVEQMHVVTSNKDLVQKQIEYGLAQLNKFSWQKCAQETLKTYNEVLNSQTVPKHD